MDLPAYAVVSPGKDEADRLEHTLRSLCEQSHPPVEWVIVDDGSSDGTREVATSWAERKAWITVLGPEAATDGERPGAGRSSAGGTPVSRRAVARATWATCLRSWWPARATGGWWSARPCSAASPYSPAGGRPRSAAPRWWTTARP